MENQYSSGHREKGLARSWWGSGYSSDGGAYLGDPPFYQEFEKEPEATTQDR